MSINENVFLGLTIFLVVMIIFGWISMFMSFYHLRQFWRLRNEQLISKRRPILILTLIIVGNIHIKLIWPFGNTYEYLLLYNKNYANKFKILYNSKLTYSLYLHLMLFLIVLMVFIIWLFYFDWRKNMLMLQSKWEDKLLLKTLFNNLKIEKSLKELDVRIRSTSASNVSEREDSGYSTVEESKSHGHLDLNTPTQTTNDVDKNMESIDVKVPWTAKLHKCFKIEKYIILISCFYAFGTFGITISFKILKNNAAINTIWLSCLVALPCIPMLVLLVKSKNFVDAFGVKSSLKQIFWTVIIAAIIFVGVRICVRIFAPEMFAFINIWVITVLLIVCSASIDFALLYVKKYDANRKIKYLYCIKRNINQEMIEQNIESRTSIELNVIPSVKTTSSTMKSSNETKNDLYVIDHEFGYIFKDEELFKLFATDLVKQFSIECLLYLLEFRQTIMIIVSNKKYIFKPCFIDLIDYQHNIKLLFDSKLDMDVGGLITKEILGLNSRKIKKLKLKYHQIYIIFRYLYESYISIDSFYSINISFHLRSKIIKLFHEYTSFDDIKNDVKINVILKFIDVFDKAANEMKLLLQTGCWSRFTLTQEYILWKQDNNI